MAVNYQSASAKAAKMIQTAGKSITLKVVPSGGVFDPVTGTTTPAPAKLYAVKAVELSYTAKERDGTRIQAHDRRFMVPAVALDGSPLLRITPAARLVVGGVELAVVAVQPLEPGDVVIYYDVQARG